MDYENMSKEELEKQYKWCINQLQQIANKVKLKKRISPVLLFIMLFFTWFIGIIGIYKIFKVCLFSNILVIVFLILHFICCTYCNSAIENEIKELENEYDKIVEKKNEIEKYYVNN